MSYRVAVVTDELAGINRGGGIGTCAHGLIRLLRSAGYEVDVIITEPECKIERSEFFGSRIRLLSDWLRESEYSPVDHVVRSYSVYEMLRSEPYDAVHFNDWQGSGYFYAMAKRQGLVGATVVTHTHGPSNWVRRYNLEFADINMSEVDTLEKLQIENSDFVVSPSRYLLDWYEQNGVKLPETRVINWVLPEWLDRPRESFNGPLRTRAVPPRSITELIFFGRHERRKGFELFVSAVRSDPRLGDIDLTFVGRFDRIEREFTGSRAFRLLANHRGAIRFSNNLDHKRAFSLLQRRSHAVAVMPSMIENSPCTVGECFTVGIPFVATAVGGTPELFEAGLRSPSLVEANHSALANALASVVERGMPSVGSTLDPGRIIDDWLAFHPLTVGRKPLPTQAPTPLVSVCLVHHNRPELLRRALTALDMQTYEKFEVVLVDDGSDTATLRELDLIEAEPRRFPLKLIRSRNNYLGAARNLAAQNASGEYLIFHDDDNVSDPNQIETFIKAATAGSYDILTAQYYVFHDGEEPEEGKIRYFPIGAGGSFSFFRNRFGDAHALVRREAFNKLGGFSELKGVGWEDWELFLRAHMAGMKIGLVPEPLFRYRASGHGMLSSTSPVLNHARLIAAAAAAAPPLTAEILEFIKRDAIGQDILDHTWNVLGRTEFGDLHQEMMALDPNSDDARYKLMELAFAMGRNADAIELGLGLTRGFHQVVATLEALGRRVRLSTGCTPVRAGVSRRDGPVLMAKGWLAACTQSVLADAIIHNGEIYEIIQWMPELRMDVNAHLGLDDDRVRGFRAIAVARGSTSGRARGPFSLRKGAGDAGGVRIGLTTPPNVGSVELRLPDLGTSSHVAGCIDTLTTGHLIGIEPPPDSDATYINRLTIRTKPEQEIWLVRNKGAQIEESQTDSSGAGNFHIVKTGVDEVIPYEMRPIQVFIPGPDLDLSATFYVRG